MRYGLWQNPVYVQTAGLIFAALILLAILTYSLKGRGAPYTSGWASLKSWLFVAPMLFAIFALPRPWPLVFVTWMAVLTAKSFFQMVGMYHRSWFVWVTYIFIVASGYMIETDQMQVYNLLPMLFLFSVSLIPILRNSATHMIQYIALSLLAFIFWGWSYMHMGRLLMFEGGELMVIYLYLLAEVSENSTWAISQMIGKIKPFSRISSRVSLEGMVASFAITLFVAWAFRHLLPDRSESFWIAAGLATAVFGRMGDLIINVIRRDLGVKNTGVFIIGRDGILTRVEKLIFIGPMFYYIYEYLQRLG
jgi:phosphatidate cytidylyltransferase